MRTVSERFLTREEQEQVTAAVKEAELTTSGEIVPMIVSHCHDYPMAAVTIAMSFSLPLCLALTALIGSHFWLGPQNLWLFLALFAVCYPLLYTLSYRTTSLKRFFLSPKTAAFEVREAALGAFYSEGLYKTRDENGILLFISVLEQKVWILADTGINNRIDPSAWDSIVADLTQGIKAGRRCEAICEAIRRIGEILKTHFPYRKDDTDELHNLIIR